MRPGCARTAEARLTITPGELLVTLEDLSDPDEPTQMVCTSHANSIRPPVGWSVSDLRNGHSPSRKFASSGNTGPAGETSATDESVSTESPGRGSAEPSVDSTGESADETLKTVDGSEVEVGLDSEFDPGAERPNASGLLGRAFEWTGPQRSVLTQDSDPPADN